MIWLFNTLFYRPLYNALILLLDIPYVDAGIAVIVLTLLVKFILFPLSKKSIQTQLKMKEIQAPLAEIQEKYKDDREKQAMEILALYRKHQVNPFSGIFLILLQIPVIFALYWVFFKGGLPGVNVDLLYSFVPVPESVNTHFLGLFDISQARNVLLALLAALGQYFQAALMAPKMDSLKKMGESVKDDLMRSMSIQMKYVLPIMVFIFSYSIAAVVSLYWVTSSVFAICQELYLRRKYKKDGDDGVTVTPPSVYFRK